MTRHCRGRSGDFAPIAVEFFQLFGLKQSLLHQATAQSLQIWSHARTPVGPVTGSCYEVGAGCCITPRSGAAGAALETVLVLRQCATDHAMLAVANNAQ